MGYTMNMEKFHKCLKRIKRIKYNKLREKNDNEKGKGEKR